MILRLAFVSAALIIAFAGGIALARLNGIGMVDAPEQILYAQTDRTSSDFYFLGLDGATAVYPLIPRSLMGSSYTGMDCTPEGNQIAVSMAFVLLNIHLDGSLQLINLPPGWIGGIALAPDGMRAIVTGVFPAHSTAVELYILDLGTQELSRLTENSLREVGASWSPDATRIAFNYLDEGRGGSGIAVIDMDNPAETDIVRTERVTMETPDWSPDGTQLVYASGTTFGSSLYRMEADGSDPTFLLQMPTPIIRVRWSSDGDMISFNRMNVRDGWQVFALDLRTRLLRQFTYASTGYQNINGCWLPAYPTGGVRGDAAAS